ncbi:hypothetical protein AN644_03410 [Candidatus Epulonipiscium fishelsonii]|nr:hypothetical protein AN644_03410 [Epulopiscium sp. SCG-C06WGA-EpuloA1]
MINFQAHITIESLQNTKKYIELCKDYNVKPILLNWAQGNFYIQSIYKHNFDAENFESAFQIVNNLKTVFAENGFYVIRTKIEIDVDNMINFFGLDIPKLGWVNNVSLYKPSEYDNIFGIDITKLHWKGDKFSSIHYYKNEVMQEMKDSYIEHKIKVKSKDFNLLKKIAIKHGFSLSKNELEPDINFFIMQEKNLGDSYNYLELYFNSKLYEGKDYIDADDRRLEFSRQFNCSIAFRTIQLIEELYKYNIEIMKDMKTCCIYDDNPQFDDNRKFDIDYAKINLEIKEEIMLYIVNNLPFALDGNFDVKRYPENVLRTFENYDEINLVYLKNFNFIKPKIKMNIGVWNEEEDLIYNNFLHEIENVLKIDIQMICRRLEKIIVQKLDPLDHPRFTSNISFELNRYKMYETDTKFIIDCRYVMDNYINCLSFKIIINIDRKLDVPLISSKYITLNKEEIELKKIVPPEYQLAWYIYHFIDALRMGYVGNTRKDNVVNLLYYIDLKDERNLIRFLNIIIDICLKTDEGTSIKLLNTFTMLFYKDDDNLYDIFSKYMDCAKALRYMTDQIKKETDFEFTVYAINKTTERIYNFKCKNLAKALREVDKLRLRSCIRTKIAISIDDIVNFFKIEFSTGIVSCIKNNSHLMEAIEESYIEYNLRLAYNEIEDLKEFSEAFGFEMPKKPKANTSNLILRIKLHDIFYDRIFSRFYDYYSTPKNNSTWFALNCHRGVVTMDYIQHKILKAPLKTILENFNLMLLEDDCKCYIYDTDFESVKYFEEYKKYRDIIIR